MESIESSERLNVEHDEVYLVYREIDLKNQEQRLIQNSRWHQEVASMRETTEAAMASIETQNFTAQEFGNFLLRLGFVRVDEEHRGSGSSATISRSSTSLFQRLTSQSDDFSESFSIGDAGPNGGLIFWINDGDKSLPDALELAPVNWFDATTNEIDCPMKWCLDADDLHQVQMNSKKVGSGRENRDAIDDSDLFCAPQFQIEQFLDEDWMLPTIDELKLIYTNLHLRDLGALKGSQYWSSSVFVPPYVYSLNFESGEVMMSDATMALYIRPVREIWLS